MQESLSRAGLELREGADGLALVGDGLVLCADFTHMMPRLRQGNVQRELLVKATRVKIAESSSRAGASPMAVDATAGLGEDAVLLAASGFSVRMYERNAVVAALLKDALRRAQAVPELSGIVARMSLCEGDSVNELPLISPSPDVVFLDPMFPAKTKSAIAKKKLQMLQRLEQPCEDEADLLQAAFDAHPRKVVVKRPVKGPHLAGRKPSYSLKGKTVRYDCYVLASV